MAYRKDPPPPRDSEIDFVERSTAALAYRHVISTRELNGNVEETSDAVFANLASANPWDNGVVILTRPSPAAFAATIDYAEDFFESTPFTVWSPWFNESYADDRIEIEGHPPLMAQLKRKELAPITDFEIREARDKESIALLDDTARLGFESEHGMSICREETVDKPFQMFVGYWNGAPVSCSIATIFGGVVLVEGVATLPEARGHGFGSAMTQAAADVAPDLPAILTASESGLAVYKSLGFEIVSDYTIWQRILPAT